MKGSGLISVFAGAVRDSVSALRVMPFQECPSKVQPGDDDDDDCQKRVDIACAGSLLEDDTSLLCWNMKNVPPRVRRERGRKGEQIF